MSLERSPESVLANIPGWEDGVCRALAGGTNNRTFLVEKGGKRAVLKIDVEARALPFNTRESEERVQTTAANYDLASRVLFMNDCVYMSEYADGQVWSRADFEEEQNIVNLSGAVKALHSLPLTGRTFDASVAVRTYLTQVGNRDADIVRHCAEVALSVGAPARVCCCHNDLAAGNIVSTPEIRFLDWEYACDNDPLFDIATVIAHHDLTDEQADLFLKSYFDGDQKRWRLQLQKHMRAYDALHWLWLAGRSGADENKQQLEALAERVLQVVLP